jgi:DNA-binding transcriptional LysR family regulator
VLYPRALALLEQAIEIEQLFREDNGAIRVYASSTIGNYILPEVIARYRRDFPTLPLEMSVGNSQDVINAVIDLRVDIGLIEGPCHNVDIIAEPWLEDELVVFAPRPRRCCRGGDAAALAQAPWILREQGSGTREIVDYLLLSHLPAFHWGWSWATRRRSSTRCAMAWDQLSFPARDCRTAGDGSLVEPVPLPKLVRTLWCIHHRQKHISSSLQRFLRYCDVTSGGARLMARGKLCFTNNPGRS